MGLLNNVRTEASHLMGELAPEFHTIAALVWRDANAAAGGVGAAAPTLGAKDLNALKDMALQIVTNTDTDPHFKHAIGCWKLGHACMMLVAQLGKGLLTNIPNREQGTIETLIQATFAAMVTLA